MVRTCVDDFVLVSDEEIARGMLFGLEKHHQVVEGARAVGLAALPHRKLFDIGCHVVAVVSGGNVELSLLRQLAPHSS